MNTTDDALRQRILGIVRDADRSTLFKVGIALGLVDIALESDQGDGRGAAKFSESQGGPGVEKFSEAQSRDWQRVRQYIAANRAELERTLPGSADECLRTFRKAIADGHQARDLIGS